MADTTTIRIIAHGSQAKRELSSLGSSFGALDKQVKASNASMLASGAAITAMGAAAVGAAAAVVRMADQVAKQGDRIAKTARIVGVSGKAYQELSFAADRAGVSTSALDNGLKRLSRNLLDANTGNARLAQTFADMEIETRNAATGGLRNAEDVLRDIADRVKTLGPGTQVTAELMTVLGRSGADMANLLAGGSEEIDRLAGRLAELDGLMSDELLASSEAYEDSLTDLKVAFGGLKNRLAEEVIPEMTRFNKSMTEGLAGFNSFLAAIQGSEAKGSFGDRVMNAISRGARAVGLSDFADSLDSGRAAERERRQLQAAAGPSANSPMPSGRSGIAGSGSSRAPKMHTAAMPSFRGIGQAVNDTAIKALTGFSEQELAEGAARFASFIDADMVKREQEARQIEELEQRKRDEYERTRNFQMQATADVFGAVSTFAELGQRAVEDSYFGQTKAGKTAAKALFVASKVAAMAQAAVNTALAISNTLANVQPPPAAAAAAVGMGAAAAAQIGVIAATTIQGLADAGLAPGALKAAGLNNHTVVAMRNDEAIIDPKGTSEITQMLALQRRQMEMRLSDRGANSAPASPVVVLDGRRVSRGLRPYETEALEDGYDARRNVRYSGVA